MVLSSDYADGMAVWDNPSHRQQDSTDLLAHYCGYTGLRIQKCKKDPMHGK